MTDIDWLDWDESLLEIGDYILAWYGKDAMRQLQYKYHNPPHSYETELITVDGNSYAAPKKFIKIIQPNV